MTSGNSQLQSEIKLNGRVIPLKSIKLREAFASLTEIEKEITALKAAHSAAADGGDAASKNNLVALQLRLVNMLDDVVQLITKEKKEEQMRSDASG